MRWGRRILGWLWVATVVVSAVLFLVITVLAVRSFWVQDMAQGAYQWFPTPNTYSARWVGVGSYRGTLRFSLVRNDFDLTQGASIVVGGDAPGWANQFRAEHVDSFRGGYYAGPALKGGSDVNWFRPDFVHQDHQNAGRHDEYWTLWIPSYYLSIALATLPLIAIRRWRKKRRIAREGLCKVCGYDLRASVERCPECGTAIEARGVIT